jgi:anti-sigma B factor antagonist
VRNDDGRSADGAGPAEQPVAGIERDDGAVVVRLAGELDLYTAPTVRAELLAVCAESPERLVVDLSAVEFIDSTALGVLIEARSRLAEKDAFMLESPRLAARRALQISGLDRHFAVYDSLADALSSPSSS